MVLNCSTQIPFFLSKSNCLSSRSVLKFSSHWIYSFLFKFYSWTIHLVLAAIVSGMSLLFHYISEWILLVYMKSIDFCVNLNYFLVCSDFLIDFLRFSGIFQIIWKLRYFYLFLSSLFSYMYFPLSGHIGQYFQINNTK